MRGKSPRKDDTLGHGDGPRSTRWPTSLRGQDLGAAEAARSWRQADRGDRGGHVRVRRRPPAAHDQPGRLRAARPAARAPARPHADDLGLAQLLELDAPARTARAGRLARAWELRRTPFRERGRPLTLVVLSDVSRALREEERQAWQRLVRVLSHEINNSLAPISSIAGILRQSWRGDPAAARLERGRRARTRGHRRRADSLAR